MTSARRSSCGIGRIVEVKLLAASALLLAFVAGCSSTTSTPAPTSSVTATIGTAGGTVTGPNGVQVVIPAGALDGNTTIGIAQNTAGAPGGIPAGLVAPTTVYEFTPHGQTFKKPVLFRLPIPAGVTDVLPLINSAIQNDQWMPTTYVVNGGFVEFERLTFSWGGMMPCASSGQSCTYVPASGWTAVTATSPTALVQGGNSGWGGRCLYLILRHDTPCHRELFRCGHLRHRDRDTQAVALYQYANAAV